MVSPSEHQPFSLPVANNGVPRLWWRDLTGTGWLGDAFHYRYRYRCFFSCPLDSGESGHEGEVEGCQDASMAV